MRFRILGSRLGLETIEMCNFTIGLFIARLVILVTA